MKQALQSGGMGAVADMGAGGAAKLGGMMTKGFGFGGKALGSFFWREQARKKEFIRHCCLPISVSFLRLFVIIVFGLVLDCRTSSCCEGQYFLDVYSQPFYPPPLYSSDYHSFVCWLVLKYIIVIPFKLKKKRMKKLNTTLLIFYFFCFLDIWGKCKVLKRHCT